MGNDPATTSNRQTFTLVLFVVYSICVFLGCTLLFVQRGVQPIRARSAGLLGISTIGGYLLCVWAALISSEIISPISGGNIMFNCDIRLWVLGIGHSLFFFPYFIRALRLRAVFLNAVAESPQRRRHLSATSRLARWMAVAFAVCLILFAIRFVSPTAADFLLCQPAVYACPVWVAVATAEVLCLLAASYVLSRVWRDFNMRSETLAVSAICLVFLLFSTISSSSGGGMGVGSAQQQQQLQLWLPFAVFARSALAFLISVALPLCQSFCCPPLTTISLPSCLGSLSLTLTDPTALSCLESFLDHEGRISLLLFWQEVEMFREVALQELPAEAERIVAEYLLPNAPLRLRFSPLPSSHRRRRRGGVRRSIRSRSFTQNVSCSALSTSSSASSASAASSALGQPIFLAAGGDDAVAAYAAVAPTWSVARAQTVIRAVRAAATSPSLPLFDEVQAMVFEDLQRHYFPMFQRSEFVGPLLTRLQSNSVLRSSLLHHDMIDAL